VVYRTESGSVHFGWAALEDQSDGGYQRTVQVPTLGRRVLDAAGDGPRHPRIA